MRLTYEVYHVIRHQCLSSDKAATEIARLTDPKLKYYYSHNMTAKIHRQSLSYHFVLHDPATIDRKLPVR